MDSDLPQLFTHYGKPLLIKIENVPREMLSQADCE